MPQVRERRLAAILAADVAGYARLTGADEEGTHARLMAHRAEFFDPKIREHGGRIVKNTGDGALVEFGSVVNALRCAIDLQRGMAERNIGLPEDGRIEFRIGINVGDVIVEPDDIYGDGVNIAVRLEGLAEPNGICLSEAAYRHARGKIATDFVDLGERSLKNIALPERVYAVLPAAIIGAAELRPARPRYPALPDKPSIAVLPFNNLSADPDQEYFADALSEDIVTALSRWRWFFVIARNSSFIYKGRRVEVKQVGRELGVRYLLEGSVRKVGTRVRVTAQLIDAVSAAHLWADNFDRELVDIFALQDEITERVVSAIEPAMLHSEGLRVVHKNVTDLSAFDHFQRGMWHFNEMTAEGYREALSLFRQTIARDANLALGYVGLARSLYAGVNYGWSERQIGDLEEALQVAQTALRLDARDAYAYFALSGAALCLGRHQEALDAAEKALALNPNFAFGHFRLGQVLTYIGRAAEAVAPLERSMRHSPYDPQFAAMVGQLALAHYQAHDYAEAARQAQIAAQLGSTRAVAVWAASLARLGRKQEASAALAAFLPELELLRAGRTRRLIPYAHPAYL